jgi:hypothetical protein
MKKIIRNQILMMALILTPLAHAQADKADELAMRLQYAKLLEQANEACISTVGASSAESMFENNPKLFYGLTPKSKNWPEVVEIVKEYVNNTCRYFGENEFVSLMASSFRENLSEQELQRANEFYSTELGKKLINANVEGNAKFQMAANKEMTGAKTKADDIYVDRLAKIVLRENYDTCGCEHEKTSKR